MDIACGVNVFQDGGQGVKYGINLFIGYVKIFILYESI